MHKCVKSNLEKRGWRKCSITLLRKYGSMEGEVRERLVKGKQSKSCIRGSYGRKCEQGVKEGYKKQHYPPNSVICMRYGEECSTVIMNMCSRKELYKSCIYYVRVGQRE